MTIKERSEAKSEYNELKDNFMSYVFDMTDPQFKRLIELERVLIAEGILKPIWA